MQYSLNLLRNLNFKLAIHTLSFFTFILSGPSAYCSPKNTCLADELRAAVSDGGTPKGAQGVFKVDRGANDLLYVMPRLEEALKKLPAESVVLDLGGGKGSTILSLKNEGMGHLQYILSTATRSGELEPPYLGKGAGVKNVKVLAESFFEDHSAKDIVGMNGKKPTVAYDLYGVLSYTSHPERTLRLLYDSMADHGKVYLYGSFGQLERYTHNWIQLGDGRFVSYLDFIKEHGGFDVEVMNHEPTLRKPDDSLDSGPYLILTQRPNQPPHYPDVEVVMSRGYKPPQQIFRTVDATLSVQQKLRNEALLWSYDQIPGMGSNKNSALLTRRVSKNHPSDRNEDFKGLEKTLSLFSDSTVIHTDPQIINDMLIGKITYSGAKSARVYFNAHRETIRATGEFGIAAEALLDLSEGKNSSASIDYLKKKLSKRIAPAEWSREAKDENSKTPFTVRSILESILGFRENSSRRDDRTFELSFTPDGEKLSSDIKSSLEISARILIEGWSSNPKALGWLKQTVGLPGQLAIH